MGCKGERVKMEREGEMMMNNQEGMETKSKRTITSLCPNKGRRGNSNNKKVEEGRKTHIHRLAHECASWAQTESTKEVTHSLVQCLLLASRVQSQRSELALHRGQRRLLARLCGLRPRGFIVGLLHIVCCCRCRCLVMVLHGGQRKVEASEPRCLLECNLAPASVQVVRTLSSFAL